MRAFLIDRFGLSDDAKKDTGALSAKGDGEGYEQPDLDQDKLMKRLSDKIASG